MDIPRIDASLVRVLASTDAAAPPVRLTLGERVTAQVAGQLADGRVLLDIKGQTIEARSALPLAAGQSVDLEVAGLGREIALRVLGSGGIVSEQRLALGILAAAHASTAPGPPPDVGALLRALEMGVTALSNEQRAALARLLGPLRADATAGALASDLQHVLENGGLLFESRVRAWLQSATPAPSTQTLPADLASDLKVLLGVLGRALQTAAGTPAVPATKTNAAGETSGDQRAADLNRPSVSGPPGQAVRAAGDERTVVDSLQRRAIDLVHRELDAVRVNDRPALETLRAEHAHVRNELQSRQVESAYHWVRDGTLSLQLPLALGDLLATAWLRFHRGEVDADRRANGRGAPAVHSFDLALDTPWLGPLRAHVAWSGPQLRVQFFVAKPPSAAVISPALPELSSALMQAGFSKVDAEVTVDASRCRLDPLAPMARAEGGTILNLRA